MRRHLLLILGVCGLLLTPNAGGGPAIPGDPTPPVVTPHIFGTLGLSGWYVTNVTVNWTVEDPESQILETQGCNAVTLVNDTTGTALTCYARSDAGETTVTITIRLDKTAPTVTATPARSPDSNGWYNHTLSVSFSGTDATSGIDSCIPPQTYSGPDSANASVSGSCRDRAGNTGTRMFGLSYDATAPQVTGANASRGPDHAGWYNHTLSISFTGTDATSGVDTCSQSTYSGPDDATASVNGTCRDRAGNTSNSSTFNFQYDETNPTVTAAPSRAPDLNGWYNHTLTVSFNGADATSGLESCVPPVSYSGPDSANASVSGTCTDHAGNSGARSFGFSYDDTAPQVTSATPSRSPDHGAWYNHTFSITFAGTDATSGVDTCTQATYSGPDDATASVNGTCRDRAGNTSTPSPFNFQYDETAPTVTANPSRTPDSNGWYNHALAVSFAGTDATSGLDSCVPPQTYSGPDSPNASVSGSCLDRAGNTRIGSFGLSYDSTAPLAYGVPARDPDSNGWYNEPLRVDFGGTDATSGIDSCTAPSVYSGPDSAGASLTGACSDRAGNTSALAMFSLGYDASAPQVVAAPARPPDANGWYNHPLTVAFTGTDATSGIESCGRATYSGPDAAAAHVRGSCRDRAGNQGTVSIVVKYDATAPAVTLFVAKAGKHSAKLIWRTTPDAQTVQLTRSPGSRGESERVVFQGASSTTSFLDGGLRAGRKYHYRLQASDDAANDATRALEFVGRGALLYPGPGERVSRPPLLVWSAAPRATYYNLVLVRGRRVFSAWPVRARLQLPRSWRYHGRRYELRAGAYRWYVWPGRGRLAAGRYGKLLGGSSFVVSR